MLSQGRKNIFIFYLPLLIMATVQQTFETPAVYTIFILLFICINFDKNYEHPKNFSTSRVKFI